MPQDIAVGTTASPAMLSGDFETRKSLINLVVQLQIDHVFLADHVSFHTGLGMDGLINAATISAMHPTLKVCIGVYLLALRHPVTVARQLATLSQSAPGRITLGIGVGGEDRHEMEVCGVDPATRGRQTDDCLEVIRALATGEPFSFKGDFFEIDNALIKPSVTPPMPILVGGRADAAIRRAGRYSAGWLGIWSSADRFGQVTAQVETHATDAGRTNVEWNHGLQLWAGLDDNKTRAREIISRKMQQFYQVPFTAFEKYCPYGSPEEIAAFLIPYRDKGCRLFNIKACAMTEEAEIEGVARIRELLLAG